jgi:F-type H+-transporting ATPase subunit epsilon
MSKFAIELTTPEGQVYSGEVSSVQVPAVDGRLEVLQDHAPMVASLSGGEVWLQLPDNTRKHYHVDGGIFEVARNKAVLLAEQIQPSDN